MWRCRSWGPRAVFYRAIEGFYRVNDAAGWMFCKSHLKGDIGAEKLLNANLEVADD